MRVLLSVWKIFNNVIPTFTNFNRHYLHCEIVCPFYGEADDSISHTFLRCSFARVVWFGLPFSLRTDSGDDQVQRWLRSWIRQWGWNRDCFNEIWLTILVGLNVIWKCRNDIIWKGINILPSPAIKSILVSINYYINVFNQVSDSLACTHFNVRTSDLGIDRDVLLSWFVDVWICISSPLFINK